MRWRFVGFIVVPVPHLIKHAWDVPVKTKTRNGPANRGARSGYVVSERD